jgi:hypothetical protein
VVSDISPKVLNPAALIAAAGATLAAVGVGVSDKRMRDAGMILLAASLAVGGLGWWSRDPLRMPYIEPGFEPEPELAEHRAREQTG